MPYFVTIDIAAGTIIGVQHSPTVPADTATLRYQEIPEALWRVVFSDASRLYEWRTQGGGSLGTRVRPGYDPNVG